MDTVFGVGGSQIDTRGCKRMEICIKNENEFAHMESRKKKYSSSWESVSAVKKLQISGLRIQFLLFNRFQKRVFVNSPLYMWTRRTPCRRHKWKGPAWINLWIIQQSEWCLTMRVGYQEINIWFKDDVSSTSFYTGENHRPRLQLLTSRLKNTI